MDAFAQPIETIRGSRVGALYKIPISQISITFLENEKKSLTLKPKQIYGNGDKSFAVWKVENGFLYVPRFYGLQKFGPADFDDRVVGESLSNIEFIGALTNQQVNVCNRVLANAFGCDGTQGAIICLPCGMGKTVTAIFLMIKHFGRKSCVLVHKTLIMDQWIQAFSNFCPNLRIGIVQGSRCEIENKDVILCMVMTIAKRQPVDGFFDSVGTVCIDECHHVAAPVMNRAMQHFCAKHILGLTATKERPDGLTRLLHWSIGEEGFRTERNGGDRVRVSIALLKPLVSEILGRDGRPLFSQMLTNLATSIPRNRFIAKRIITLRRSGRTIIVLSDRIAQLKILEKFLREWISEEEIGIFHGSTRERDRPGQLARPIVLCSYGMANEGLDKREADTCVMASPKSRVVQCIGRIQRPCVTKKTPLVIDVADDMSLFISLRWKRQRLYKNEGYEIQVLNVNVEDTATDSERRWFV